MWLVFSLLAAFLWGIGQIFIKKGMGNVSPLVYNILAVIIDLLLWFPLAFFMGINFPKVFSILPLALLAGATYFLYYYVIAKGQVSLTGTILGAYPLTTIILSAVFLGEQTSLIQKLATVLVILGSVLIAMPSDFHLKIESWVWYAAGGGVTDRFRRFSG